MPSLLNTAPSSLPAALSAPTPARGAGIGEPGTWPGRGETTTGDGFAQALERSNQALQPARAEGADTGRAAMAPGAELADEAAGARGASRGRRDARAAAGAPGQARATAAHAQAQARAQARDGGDPGARSAIALSGTTLAGDLDTSALDAALDTAVDATADPATDADAARDPAAPAGADGLPPALPPTPLPEDIRLAAGLPPAPDPTAPGLDRGDAVAALAAGATASTTTTTTDTATAEPGGVLAGTHRAAGLPPPGAGRATPALPAAAPARQDAMAPAAGRPTTADADGLSEATPASARGDAGRARALPGEPPLTRTDAAGDATATADANASTGTGTPAPAGGLALAAWRTAGAPAEPGADPGPGAVAGARAAGPALRTGPATAAATAARDAVAEAAARRAGPAGTTTTTPTSSGRSSPEDPRGAADDAPAGERSAAAPAGAASAGPAGLPLARAEAAAGLAPAAQPQPVATGFSAPTDAARTAQLAPPMHSPDFAPALGAQVTLFAREGVQQARIELNPAEMGPISVQIALDGSAARVDFLAESAATRQVIESSLPSLAGALRDAGMTLAGGGVFQQNPQPSGQGPGQGGPGSGRGRRGGDDGGEADTPANATVLRTGARRGLVDLIA